MRECFGLSLVRDICLNDDEFVASEPRHHVFDADDRAQAFTDRPEQEIAAVVAERIVDLLEVVDIDEMQRHLAAGRRTHGHGRFESLDHTRAVGEPGQRVVVRQKVDAPVGLLFLPRPPEPGDGRKAECDCRQAA